MSEGVTFDLSPGEVKSDCTWGEVGRSASLELRRALRARYPNPLSHARLPAPAGSLVCSVQAQLGECDFQTTKEANAVENRVHPAGGDAVVRLVSALVKLPVVFGREEQARALQRAEPARWPLAGGPFVDLRVAVAAGEDAEN